MDQKDIILAKKKAKKRKSSVSAMFTEWLHAESPESEKTKRISPAIKSISGIIKTSEDFDYKESKGKRIEEKYGKYL